MTPIYAAAPLSATTFEQRSVHLAAARRFADFLGAGEGFRLVYLPHTQIAVAHGYPALDETAGTRAAGMARCLSIVGQIARMGGELHVLLRADLSMSGGCAAEVAHYRDEGGEIVCGWIEIDGAFVPVEVR